VASGADRVFIADMNDLPVEHARKLPLLMAADLRAGRSTGAARASSIRSRPTARWRRWPAIRGSPRTSRPTARLAARHVARRSGAGWYRTIDRIHGELTGTPKLLIPDIKGEPMVVYDPGDYYPHHNLYHVTSARWDLRALATVLRSSIAVLFVSAYCVKMAGGFLRFQAQVLRRIRVPRWDDVTAELREALRAAGPTDLAAIDRATFAVYGLGDGDAEVVRRVAADARVRGVGGT
jgi:hypothetical protein